MSAWDYFKAGCELCAGFAQSFWDSLNVWEQIVAVAAGVIGASLVLGCTGGFLAGLIGRRIRARRERKELASDVRYAAILRMHYNPIDEFGGPCYVCERYEPVTGFDYQGQADMWLEQCQRAYWPSEEE